MVTAVEEEIDTNATAHEQIFIFCLLWSFGAFLEDLDRSRLETYLRKQTKLAMPSLPANDSIFNYNVCVHTGKWTHWDTLIKNYVPPEITPPDPPQPDLPPISPDTPGGGGGPTPPPEPPASDN